jgi:WD40 repeat protein
MPTVGETLNTSLAYSPDGQLLAVGFRNGYIGLYRVDSGALVTTLAGHTDDVNKIKFSPDGHLLASGSADGTVRLWGVR